MEIKEDKGRYMKIEDDTNSATSVFYLLLTSSNSL